KKHASHDAKVIFGHLASVFPELLPGKKESPPVNRTASNDCLPYEKKAYFCRDESGAVAEESADTAGVSTTGAGASTAGVSAVGSSALPLSLHDTNVKVPIAKTNN